MASNRPYSRSLFQKEAFNPDDFILTTRDLSFHSLNTCLNEHLGEIKKELSTIVNQEFNSFVDLFSEIGATGNEDIDSLLTKTRLLFDESKVLIEKCSNFNSVDYS